MAAKCCSRTGQCSVTVTVPVTVTVTVFPASCSYSSWQNSLAEDALGSYLDDNVTMFTEKPLKAWPSVPASSPTSYPIGGHPRLC